MNGSTSKGLPSVSPGLPSNLSSSSLPTKSRSRLLLVGALICLTTLGALLGWRLVLPSSLAPPLPDDIRDPEIQETILQARQRVLDRPTAGSWGHLGMVLLAHQFDQEATLCFREASRLDPGDSRWPYCRGMIALKREPDQAVGLLRLAVDKNTWPQYDFSMRIKLVEVLLEKNELDEVERLLRGLDPTGPNAERVAMDFGWVAMARGDMAAAQEYFRRAQRSRHLHKQATTQLAMLARFSRDAKAAEQLEKEAAHLNDDLPWPDPLLNEVLHLRMGRRFREMTIGLLEQQHKYDEVAAIYQKQLKTEPTLENYLGAGINLARLQNYDEALPLLRRAIELHPKNAQAQFTLAVTLFRRAEEHWHQHPQTPEDKLAFGEVVEHASLAARLKPDHALACLIWGTALKYLGKLEDALLPLRQGIACRPEMLDLQITLAEVLFELGKIEEAQSQLDVAVHLNAKDPRVTQLRERLNSEKNRR